METILRIDIFALKIPSSTDFIKTFHHAIAEKLTDKVHNGVDYGHIHKIWPPKGLITSTVIDPQSGLKAHEEIKKPRVEYFLNGTEPIKKAPYQSEVDTQSSFFGLGESESRTITPSSDANLNEDSPTDKVKVDDLFWRIKINLIKQDLVLFNFGVV